MRSMRLLRVLWNLVGLILTLVIGLAASAVVILSPWILFGLIELATNGSS